MVGKHAVVGLLGLILGAGFAAAEDPGGVFALTIENDVFTGSDDSYSNGLGVTWTSRDISEYKDTDFVSRWADFWNILPGANTHNAETYVTWSIAQEMHTPENIGLVTPDPNDQPYAGILQVDSTLYTARQNWMQAWSLRLGVVGPASGADETQIAYHKLIGAAEPLGWDSQIQNEPVVNVSYTAGYRALERNISGEMSFRLTPIASGEIGTYSSAIGAGLLAEFGWNMPDATSLGGLGNSLSAMSTIGAKFEEDWSVTSYVSLGGYVIGHYLPLDGPVFREGPSVGSEDFATVTNVGIALRKGDFIGSFGVAYGASPGDSSNEQLDFGVLLLAWQY